jgi:hypothetical protein
VSGQSIDLNCLLIKIILQKRMLNGKPAQIADESRYCDYADLTSRLSTIIISILITNIHFSRMETNIVLPACLKTRISSLVNISTTPTDCVQHILEPDHLLAVTNT